jgi:hypothetical protein
MGAPLNLPSTLTGHWNALDGFEMAKRYAPMTRAQLCGGTSTDMLVAFEIASLRRDDPPGIFEPTLATARDRIRWLSAQLARALQLVETAHGVMAEPSEIPGSQEWFDEAEALLKIKGEG